MSPTVLGLFIDSQLRFSVNMLITQHSCSICEKENNKMNVGNNNEINAEIINKIYTYEYTNPTSTMDPGDPPYPCVAGLNLLAQSEHRCLR